MNYTLFDMERPNKTQRIFVTCVAHDGTNVLLVRDRGYSLNTYGYFSLPRVELFWGDDPRDALSRHYALFSEGTESFNIRETRDRVREELGIHEIELIFELSIKRHKNEEGVYRFATRDTFQNYMIDDYYDAVIKHILR